LNQGNLTTTTSEICEASGCSAKSTATIAIPIGEKRSFFLSVCENCISKFQEQAQQFQGLGLNAD
jgi:hypothetical protein